uniref:Uncharacterized protein n=1 Tax=Acrobeloides nanus TaxID=290746 RepID=A0A914C483_9BILA
MTMVVDVCVCPIDVNTILEPFNRLIDEKIEELKNGIGNQLEPIKMEMEKFVSTIKSSLQSVVKEIEAAKKDLDSLAAEIKDTLSVVEHAKSFTNDLYETGKGYAIWYLEWMWFIYECVFVIAIVGTILWMIAERAYSKLLHPE